VKAVVYIRTMEAMDHRQRRQLGQQWLYHAVADYGHPEVTMENCPMVRTDKGKPFFATDPGVHFSISHSKEYWACVVSDGPVGLDLQYHKQGRLEQIPPRFFHPQEVAWLENQESPAAFFDVWTAKESYVKWTGDGIDRHFKAFAVADTTGLRETMGDAYFWRGVIGNDYSLCLCGGQPWDAVRIMKMEEDKIVPWPLCGATDGIDQDI